MKHQMTQSIKLLDLIEKYLSEKGRVKEAVHEMRGEVDWLSGVQSEIEAMIELINSYYQNEKNITISHELLVNSIHLKEMMNEILPRFDQVINEILIDNKIQRKVFFELRDSTYFNEVYQISNSYHIIINLLILCYRTTLLFQNPLFKMNNVQISSSIEEMACVLMLEGKDTELFQATKHWIINWEEEEFSEKLASLISDMN